MPSPLGELLLVSTSKGLCRVVFCEVSDRRAARALSGMVQSDDAPLREALGQLAEYFQGDRRQFDLALDLSAGTPFQQRVWQGTADIPFGEVRSYGELAAAIGAPGTARAVGQALGANPVPIVVPCHRVVSADGGLGGFALGLRIKRALLRLEGHALSD